MDKLGVLHVYKRSIPSRIRSFLFSIHCALWALLFLCTIIGTPLAVLLYITSRDNMRRAFGLEYNTCTDCGHRGTIRSGVAVKHCSGCKQVCRVDWAKAPGMVEGIRIKRDNWTAHLEHVKLLREMDELAEKDN